MLRRLLQLALPAFVALAPISVRAAVDQGVVEVLSVQPSRVADIVLLGRGFDSGLRQGMVCRITRGSLEVAEVLVVDTRTSVAAALIVTISPKQAIRIGDTANIKVLKS